MAHLVLAYGITRFNYYSHKMRNQAFVLVCIVVFGVAGTCHGGGLKKNYYADKCRDAEEIIKNATEQRVANDPTLPAKFLRMHFHDYVACYREKNQGCDASILLNSTANNTAEKDAVPNQTLSRFDAIDDIKAEVEKKCPNVVSCADVLALAARDAVEETARCREFPRCWLIFLPLPQISPPLFEISQTKASTSVTWWSYQVLLIRKHNDVGNDLQSANGKFNVGAHTFGVGHCNAFSNRLYNFTGRGDQDPSLNATYAAFLKTQCQSLSDNTTFVPMDPISVLAFDSNYYVTLKQNRGLFQSDATLLTNNGSTNIVNQLLNQNKFFAEFARSIKKMGAIGVLTGNAGEIRKKCFVVN